MAAEKKSDYLVVFVAVGALVIGMIGVGVVMTMKSRRQAAHHEALKAEEAMRGTMATTGGKVDLGSAPVFSLENARGGTLGTEALKGKIWAVDFFFTSCGSVCPQMSETMKKIDDKLKDVPEFQLLSITTDPENDTAAKLQKYAEQYGASERWHFLRGSIQDVMKAQAGFKIGNPENFEQHSAKIVLVDRDGKILGYYDGYGTDRAAFSDELIKDVKKLVGAGE